MEELRSFYKGKKILITGNTGFKGSWMTELLMELGAKVIGFALEPETDESLFNILNLENEVKTYYADIRDYESLKRCIEDERPEILIHMAAQPLVRQSYVNPRYTYECNVMGTVNILEVIRTTESVKSFVNVTTDKVYRNNEWKWGYRENETLDGFDPYSNSKSCSELVTETYKRSFGAIDAAISTARAGNVIGGGDFAKDRIIPDCFRAARKQQEIVIRNPDSIRPYQHVLEPIYAYLMIACKQYENRSFAGCYNVGPEESDCLTTGALANIFCESWGEKQSWIYQCENGPHEANFLKLDCSKIKENIGWKPKWTAKYAVEKTVEWYKAYMIDEAKYTTRNQIKEYMVNKC